MPRFGDVTRCAVCGFRIRYERALRYPDGEFFRPEGWMHFDDLQNTDHEPVPRAA